MPRLCGRRARPEQRAQLLASVHRGLERQVDEQREMLPGPEGDRLAVRPVKGRNAEDAESRGGSSHVRSRCQGRTITRAVQPNVNTLHPNPLRR